MAAPLRIVFDEWFVERNRVGIARVPLFTVWRDGTYLFQVHTHLRTSFAERALGGRSFEAAQNQVEAALLRLAARRIERGVAAGSLPSESTSEPQTVRVEEDDLAELAGLLGEKTCDYQVSDRRDLLCSAAGPKDDTVVGTRGHRRVAPTSRPICARCDLPDTDSICSNLLHPTVTGSRTKTSWDRMVIGALCDKARPEIAQPVGCRAGGHGCWERVIKRIEAVAEPVLSPLSLPEQLDFLDAVWRAVFNQRLLQLESTAHVAGLALGCSSREEFTARLSDLADVLNSLHVPNDLLGSDRRVRGALTRVERALEATVLDQDGKDRATAAIASLRSVVRIRAGLQHADVAHELHEHFDKLKVAYPSTDWGTTWQQVRARTIDALVQVRDEVRRLPTGAR
jgi:hypothetical protein